MLARIRCLALALGALAVLCAIAAPAAAQCPAKTTVADTLYNADGSLASGRVTIAWPTLLIGSCQVISGQTTVIVTNGAFNVQLYPNTNALPSGTSYRITFALKSGRITTEYWVVPASASAVAMAVVRAPTVPVPAVMFGEAQVTNLVSDLAKKVELPVPCPPGKVLESNGSATPPQVDCVDPTVGSGSQHQVNGANLASNSPVNFQDSASITFTNPSAGNVQAALADGAVNAAMLAVSNPSSAQLSGIGDLNVAAAALSPNRISGTAVTQARAVNTTSPITGGGDLSANRTIACPTCVTSVSGTANEISATGGTAPVLSLPSVVDFSGKTLKGGTPLVLDGATADSNKTTVVVTDPTAARNFTLPNADSVAVQPATCSGTDKVSAVSALGVMTCSADQSGGGSNHSLLSATHTDTVAAAPVLGDVLFANSTPAWTKLAGNSTTTKKYLAQTGTGSASAAPLWSQPAFGELSGAASAGQLPNIENQNGTLTPGKGGTGANNTATSGRYLRGDGTNFVTSSVAAAGAGSCTNKVVIATVDNAAPTCTTLSSAYVDGSIETTANKNAANGYAPLDASVKVPNANLPSIYFATSGASSGTVASSTTSYSNWTGAGGFNTTEANRSIAIPFGGTCKGLYVKTLGAQPGTGSLVVTIRKNGSDQSVTVTIAAGAAAGTYSDTSNSFTFAAGDELSIKLVNNASSVSPTLGLSIGYALTPQ